MTATHERCFLRCLWLWMDLSCELSAGSAGSTPALYPGAEAADRKVPARLHSASPRQEGRPRSAGAGAVRAPLGHSLEAGALQEV